MDLSNNNYGDTTRPLFHIGFVCGAVTTYIIKPHVMYLYVPRVVIADLMPRCEV